MEKWMIVWLLPLEVWMDIFCFPWITREEFGKIVDKIGNFKFAEHAQFYLHDWGRRTMINFTYEGDLYKEDCYHKPIDLDFPQTPLPPNIKCLGEITIVLFDSQIIAFLGHLQPLLTDLELHLLLDPVDLGVLRTILTNLVPLLNMNSIHSLHCYEDTFPLAKQLIGEKLTKSKRLEIEYSDPIDGALAEENVNSIMDWLIQPRDGPRWCKIHFNRCKGFAEQLSIAIREQFLAAKTPCTFAVNVNVNHDWGVELAEFHWENSIGEELDGVLTARGKLQITRHQAKRDPKLMNDWIKEVTSKDDCGCLWIANPALDSIDEAALQIQNVVPRVDGKEEVQQQQQQPCSSKDTEIMTIRERFLAAKTPCTFAMNLIPNGNIAGEFHLENGIGEMLHGEWTEDGTIFQITRHQAGRNMQEVRECLRIGIGHPTAVGSLGAAQMNVPPGSEEQDDQQHQQCSSKDA